MNGIAIYCKDTNDIGVVVVVLVAGLSDSNTTPGYTTLLCFALDCGSMLLNRSRHKWCWWCGFGLSDSNTTPGYTTLLCSALDCGNMYG